MDGWHVGSCLPLSFPRILPIPIKIASFNQSSCSPGLEYPTANAIAQSVKLAAIGCSTYDSRLKIDKIPSYDRDTEFQDLIENDPEIYMGFNIIFEQTKQSTDPRHKKQVFFVFHRPMGNLPSVNRSGHPYAVQRIPLSGSRLRW
jgi:hypothetical protein